MRELDAEKQLVIARLEVDIGECEDQFKNKGPKSADLQRIRELAKQIHERSEAYHIPRREAERSETPATQPEDPSSLSMLKTSVQFPDLRCDTRTPLHPTDARREYRHRPGSLLELRDIRFELPQSAIWAPSIEPPH
jgi:hypothetical protein